MALFTLHPRFREELRKQRKTIFGKHRYWLHILLWLVVALYFIIENGDDFSGGFKVGVSQSTGTVNDYNEPSLLYVTAIGSLAGAVMVYFYLLLVIPYARYKKQRRHLWLGLMINGILWITAIGISGAILGIRSGGDVKFAESDVLVMFMLSSLFSGATAGIFFALYYFLDLYDQQKELNRYQKVLTEKLQAETTFLKTQINPHFLFNTLNNIYSLALSHSSDAAVITRKLKDLITYMLQDCARDKVPLAGEIEFLNNYIDLEKVRNKQENISIAFQAKGDTQDKQIAPLLLVNFIENAFKHGVKAGIDHAFVRIDLMVMDHTLALDVINSKPVFTEDKTDKTLKKDGGIGINNVQRRLAILYPDKHKLRISESEKDYSVHLTINL